MPGYSHRSLAAKLGIADGARVVALDAPRAYDAIVDPLPSGVTISTRMAGTLRFVHVFATKRRDLARRLERLRDRIEPDGVIWVSWPKRAAKMETDVTEDVVRELALPIDLVDVKVCAVDETWSALKLMIRREKRQKRVRTGGAR